MAPAKQKAAREDLTKQHDFMEHSAGITCSVMDFTRRK